MIDDESMRKQRLLIDLSGAEPNSGRQCFPDLYFLLCFSAFQTRKMDLLSSRWVLNLLVCIFFVGKLNLYIVEHLFPHMFHWWKRVCLPGFILTDFFVPGLAGCYAS